jgi:hypothetical protein
MYGAGCHKQYNNDRIVPAQVLRSHFSRTCPRESRHFCTGRKILLALLLVGFVGWWLVRGSVRLSFRFLVLGSAVACAIAVTFLLHRTVLAVAIHVLALQALVTAWTLWLLVSRSAKEKVRFAGMLVLPAVVWLPGTMVRMEGLKGDGSNDFHWRWVRSAEERFMQESGTLSRASDQTVATGVPLVAAASDWPGFRGPDLDASAPGFKIATDWELNPARWLPIHAGHCSNAHEITSRFDG